MIQHLKLEILTLLLVAVFTGTRAAQNTVVTYQGRVESGGTPFSGNQIVNGGNVGIGADPGAFTLGSNGDAAKPGGGFWSDFSDSRLKRDIEPLEPGPLDRLLSLQGCTFEYVEQAIEERLDLPGRQTGFVAQEAARVFPEWVKAYLEGYLYVTERGTTSILVEALREMRTEKGAEISQLKESVAELKQLVATLREQFDGRAK